MSKKKQPKKTRWQKFQDWAASWWPGVKTEVVTAIGAIGSLAASLQDYISGIPLDKLITPTKALIATAVLFTLAFWFRRLGKRDV